MKIPNRATLDEWLPTVVRWLGVATILYGLIHGFTPTLVTAITGMFLIKTVTSNT